ncbi:hypothetical protein TRFO_18690 [Tritrichomonas foetus]|uniref:Uncharacterized protein n=1 Tax=Tritrichomonas foetus TaxID=1144522 RepID=A0A1J4KLH3_9EUKA|nr:hypothetical protein TRFO_18690 [Tritrichomonas foetus]|eukprot:OHT11792.1 hypothetical protein TRFO_18690 [Tritrichomonas foetus]
MVVLFDLSLNRNYNHFFVKRLSKLQKMKTIKKKQPVKVKPAPKPVVKPSSKPKVKPTKKDQPDKKPSSKPKEVDDQNKPELKDANIEEVDSEKNQNIITNSNPNNSENISEIQTESNKAEKEKNMKTEKDFELPKTSFLSSTIASFHDIENFEQEEFDFTNVPILTFDGVSKLVNASSIFVKNALFTSFKYSVRLEKLKKVDFSGSPISLKSQYRVMVLFAFGNQIEEIDGKMVTPEEKSIFEQLDNDTHKLISSYVNNGGILMKEINNEFIEEIQKRNIPQPILDIPIESTPIENDCTNTSFKPFLTKHELEKIFSNNSPYFNRNTAQEVTQEQNLRNLINLIEMKLFDTNNLNVLPSQTDLVKICNEQEIINAENEAFQIIESAIIQIGKNSQESIQKIQDIQKNQSNNAMRDSIFNDQINILTNLQRKVDEFRKFTKGQNRSFDSITKHINIFEPILNKKRNISGIMNQLFSLFNQVLAETENLTSFSIPHELCQFQNEKIREIIETPKRLDILIPDLLQTIEKVENEGERIELGRIIDTLKIKQQINHELNKVINHLRKTKIYVTLIHKTANPQFLHNYSKICKESSQMLNHIHTNFSHFQTTSNSSNHSNSSNFLGGIQANLEKIAQIEVNLLFISDKIETVEYNLDNIQKVYEMIPKYSEIVEIIEEAIGKARENLKSFSLQSLSKLKQKVNEYWEDGNEYQIKRQIASEKVEKVGNFLNETFEWQERSGSVLCFINDLCSSGEAVLLKSLKETRQPLINKLTELKQTEKEKDEEIKKLLEQIAELGINV